MLGRFMNTLLSLSNEALINCHCILLRKTVKNSICCTSDTRLASVLMSHFIFQLLKKHKTQPINVLHADVPAS